MEGIFLICIHTHMQMPTHSSKQSAYSAMEMSILLILRKKQQRVGMPLSEENLKHNISESVALRKWKSDWSHQWAQIKRARGLADGDVAGKWKRKQDRGQMRSPQESGVHVRGHKNHF